MKKYMKVAAPILAAAMVFTGCSNTASVESSSETEVETQAEGVETETSKTEEASVEIPEERVSIALSDDQITVDGEEISSESRTAVYAGADIIYYEEGKDETYGEGSAEDAHSAKEATAHTVVTITQPGTYEISGSISAGQIVVDLGEDAKENPEAVVNLVLNNAEINCSVAPGILVLNAYECGSDSEEDATPNVDTTAAGFNLILAKDSENTVNGSYVAKIYKDGTTKEDVENDEAKKKYKFDAAVQSMVSCNLSSQENGKLTVNAENEGISCALHMTINSGEIVINAADDAINTNEDYVSVLTINGGVLTCDSGLGEEGDGIDSNGYIVMNGGYVIACANAKSGDSGVDADLDIYLNGGTLLASGNMYDEVSSQSAQQFVVFSFADPVKENELIMITDENDQPITAFSAVNDYSIVVYSCPDLVEGTYHLYKVSSVEGELNGSIYTNIAAYEDAVQLQYTSNSMMGSAGMGQGKGGFAGGEMPEGEMPEMKEGEAPEMPEKGEFSEEMKIGEAPAEGERPEMKEGEMPEMKEGEAPEKPEGETFEAGKGQMKGKGNRPNGGGMGETETSIEFVLSKENFQFSGISEK